MKGYFLKRLLYMPVTLFLILVVNFSFLSLMNKAPQKEPKLSSYLESSMALSSYNQSFRERYGLDHPLIFNKAPFIKRTTLEKAIEAPTDSFLNQVPLLAEPLFQLCQKGNEKAYPYLAQACIKKVLGRKGYDGQRLSQKQLHDLAFLERTLKEKSWENFDSWLIENLKEYPLRSTWLEKIKTAFTQTQAAFYFQSVLSLNFGRSKLDSSQDVVSMVFSHLKVSLFLLIGPIVLTFLLSQLFGVWMAFNHTQPLEKFLTFCCMFLYAIPIYLVVPWLIETFKIPLELPIYGSFQEKGTHVALWRQLALPYIALTFGSFALYSRFNKTLLLSIFNKPYLKVARAKGLGYFRLIFFHSCRESIMTLIPLFLGGLGAFLSSLILVETLFEIRGFGFLFYQAMMQRDYHVLLFSTLTASCIAMIGHYLADFFIYKLDPRASLENGYQPFAQY